VAWTTFPSAGAKLRASVLQSLIEEIRPNGARKTANETVNNSNTVQNDDELFVSVAASMLYVATGHLIYTSGTTPDFRWTWSLPAGATHSTNTRVFSRSLSAPSMMVDTRTFTSGNNGADGLGTTVATQAQIIEFAGIIQTSATAGTARIQWAQNTQNLSDTILYAGSWIELRRITAS
jgi:hypothetical protein